MICLQIGYFFYKLVYPTLKKTDANFSSVWSVLYISQLLMTASTDDLPPIRRGTHDLAAHRFLPQTHTRFSQSTENN